MKKVPKEQTPEHPITNPALGISNDVSRFSVTQNLMRSVRNLPNPSEFFGGDECNHVFDTITQPYAGAELDYWVQFTEEQALLDTNERLPSEVARSEQEMQCPTEESFEESMIHCPDDYTVSTTCSSMLQDSSPKVQESLQHGMEGFDTFKDDHAQSVGAVDDDDISLDGVTKQLSSRLGSLQIAEDGQLRYFGATSNLHIVHNGPFSLSQPSIRTVQTNGDAAISQAGLQWAEDLEYEEHLINLFFTWHNPIMNAVDKVVFLRERHRYSLGESTSYYSMTIVNAM
jgi:hypothetical protein